MYAMRAWIRRHFPRLATRLDGMALRVLLWTLDGCYPVTAVTYDLRRKDGEWLVNLAFDDSAKIHRILEIASESAPSVAVAIEAFMDMVTT